MARDLDASHAAGDFGMTTTRIVGLRAFEDMHAEEKTCAKVTRVNAALLAQGQNCWPTRAPSTRPLTASQHNQLDATFAANGPT